MASNGGSEFRPWTAEWENNPDRSRAVLSRCVRCERTVKLPNGKFERGALEAFEIVSRTGIAHIGADYGMTSCGIDATSEGWWWPV